MKERLSEEQIIGFLHGCDAGLAIEELCRAPGLSEARSTLEHQVCQDGCSCLEAPEEPSGGERVADHAAGNEEIRQQCGSRDAQKSSRCLRGEILGESYGAINICYF